MSMEHPGSAPSIEAYLPLNHLGLVAQWRRSVDLDDRCLEAVALVAAVGREAAKTAHGFVE